MRSLFYIISFTCFCLSMDAFNKPRGLIANRLALHSLPRQSLYFMARYRNHKLCSPRPSSPVTITTQPSPAHNNLGGSMRLLLDSLVRHLMTDLLHRCADKCPSSPLSSSLSQCFLCVGLRRLQTYILHPSLKDDLMGLTAAITILAGVNRNSM